MRFPGRRKHKHYFPVHARDPLFQATAEATEEAVIDSMICSKTMVGRDGNRSIALPHEDLLALMRKYGRL